MFEIQLYNYSGLPNVMDKTLALPIRVMGVFYSDTNVLYPTIKLHKTAQPFNYVYIQKLKRFYFVDGITVVDSNFISIRLSVDVLNTYKDVILGCTATSVCCELPNYVNNNTPVYDIRPQITKIEFEDKLNHEGNIIMVNIKGK